MKLKTYVVSCTGEPSCIVVAENKAQAIKIAKEEELKATGDNQCEGWEAVKSEEYFSDEYDPCFQGWLVKENHKYQKYLY